MYKMVKYNCERCGYETERKSNFKNHLNRKKLCLPLLDDVSVDYMKYKYGLDPKYTEHGGYPPKTPQKNSQLYHPKTTQKPPFLSNDESEVPPKKRVVFCLIKQNKSPKNFELENFENSEKRDIHCLDELISGKNEILESEKIDDFDAFFDKKNDEIFDKKKAKKKTKKQSKNAISETPENLDLTMIDTDQKLRCHFCERKFSSLKHKYRHQKHNCKVRKEIEKTELSDEIDKLKYEIENMKKNGKTVQYIKNQNIIQNNIIINNYRSENIDYISNRLLERLIKSSPYTSIPRLTECIHFNTEHPENHNLAITNIRSKLARVRQNNMWQVKFLNELLEELINTKFNIIDNFYEFSGIKDKLTDWKLDNYEQYRKLLFKDSKIRDRIKKRLFESIVNFTKELGLKCK